MKNKGLTLSMIFEAESANYGEGVGNVTALKKMSRGDGETYSYISRQALRYNMIQQLGYDNTPLDLDGTVIQFSQDAKIDQFPEIDLFGYMKTAKPMKSRAAVVRLSSAMSLEPFQTDVDFLTNKGLLDRFNDTHSEKKEGGNIAQSEIHKSFYAYTITVDLDLVGREKIEEIDLSNEEKETRVHQLLDTVKFLYRDIKGRRENLTPVFMIGGVYERKNPFFDNRLKLKKRRLLLPSITDVLNLDTSVKEQTHIGLHHGFFDNEHEIQTTLEPVSISVCFEQVKDKVSSYYHEGE